MPASCQPYRLVNPDDHQLAIKLTSAGLGACSADLITYPLDMAKVRLQVSNSVGPRLFPEVMEMLINGDYVRRSTLFTPSLGMMGTLNLISRREGIQGIYAGLTAGLQRQLCFSSIRIGFYDDVKLRYQKLFGQDLEEKPNVLIRILSGMTTGSISVTVAQPTEVVKIRMQVVGAGMGSMPGGTMRAYLDIARKDGFRGLWRGYVPNVIRNTITGVCELVTYDLIKEKILSMNLMTDSFPCHVVSGFSAGFVATVVASPVDVVKTRYISNPGQYTNVLQCARLLVKECGLGSLYKGFLPSFLRFGSWNILTFVCYEQLLRFFSGKQRQ
ncbi:mitochondrial uncoupling protein 2-like [Mya arenaria]|uniref:mitochondrial uncoupling protein 2-like n=1 Tax=Mya arenaria TaxID=6604 RepID=UPI0022E1456E|nr:mitochondrial uncoupling protein 2-like [Mya arenaria]